MAYSKVVWDEEKAITAERLNQMETQYDEAVTAGINLRKDTSKAIKVEVASTLPAAGNAGRVIFNSTNNHLYYDNGTAWKVAGLQSVMLYDHGAGAANWEKGCDRGTVNHTRTLSFETDHIKLIVDKAYSSSEDNPGELSVVTKTTYDLAEYPFVVCKLEKDANSNSGRRIQGFVMTATNKTGRHSSGDSKSVGFSGYVPNDEVKDQYNHYVGFHGSTRMVVEDTGDKYIRIHAWVDDHWGPYTSETRIYSVYLIKALESL